VAYQGTVHLACDRLFPSSDRSDLVDRSLCDVVLVTVKGAEAYRLQTQLYQRL